MVKTAVEIQGERKREKEKWLAIFPAEIWRLILDWINDADTLSNLATASTWMTEMLRPQRCEYLFAPVLALLDKQKYLDFTWIQKKDKQHVNLLQCRLVSTSWKKAVDDLLPLRPFRLEKLSSVYFYPRISSCVYDLSRKTFDAAYQAVFVLYKYDIEKFQTELLPELDAPYYRTNSPSPSRNLDITELDIIGCRASGIFERYRVATEAFLEKVGHHFWHARIAMCEDNSNLRCSQWYIQLRKYILLMPNLRSLHILTPWMWLKRKDLNNLAGLVRDLPFPPLPHLSLLNIHKCPYSLINSMIEANTQLKMLSFATLHDKNVTCSVTEKLVNPEKLSIFITLPKELDQLPNTWKLTFIRLKFPEEDFFEWSHVLTKLESYQDTLTDAHVYLCQTKIEKEKEDFWKQSKIMLNLPNVKHFNLQVYDVCSLDFLLGLSSLKYLELHLYHVNERPSWFDPASERINFRRGRTIDFSKSNIWDLIPSLEKVSVETLSQATKTYKRNCK